jgi:proteasome assembly chaperone (PAC2) family protein
MGEFFKYNKSMENIQILDIPSLKSPVLIIGFGGWPNAADVSTGAIEHLIKALKAKNFAKILPWPFYDFTDSRPVVVIDEGTIKGLQFISNEFYYWKREGGPNDLIIFQGHEPHLRWNLYVESILDIAALFDVKSIYTIGGTFDNIPHTVEPKVSALITDERLREKLIPHGIEFSNYTGPVSIHSILLAKAKERGFECISLWGHAPYYIQVHNANVSYTILSKMEKILGIDLRLLSLKERSDYLDEQVNKAIEKKPELKEYIRNLEREYIAELRKGKEKVEMEGNQSDKVIEIKAFLKKYPLSEEEKGN